MSDIDQIVDLINEIIAGAFKVGGSGFFGKLKEGGAIIEYVSEANEKYEDSAIIQNILANMSGGDLRGIDLDTVKPEDALNSADTLNMMLGNQGDDVKQFVVELVERIISASGSGLFGGGDKVSSKEAEFLNILKVNLGM